MIALSRLIPPGLCLSLLCLALLTSPASHGQEERAAYYRYTNAQGVKVMGHSIPPEFAQRGYEVLGATGRVIKVVPPALTTEDIKALEARRALHEEYTQLARRYSSAKDIDSAKERQLERLDANISLTRSNVNNLKRQIENYSSKAAEFERAAQPVPENLLDSMKKTQQELAVAENLLLIRQQEKQQVVDKFEREKAVLLEGKALGLKPLENPNSTSEKP
jgi:predicted RNase H-like nuclease (RuvC/YqgF family)